LIFDVDSTVNPTDTAQIFEEGGRVILAPFRFTEPPSLRMAGTVFGEPRQEKTRVTFSGQAGAPLEYHGIALDHLTVEGEIEGDAWTLPRLDGGFAEGDFKGHVRKWT